MNNLSNAYEEKTITFQCGHKETVNNINIEYFEEFIKQMQRLDCYECLNNK